jgi:ribosomal protein L11 methyltransferase
VTSTERWLAIRIRAGDRRDAVLAELFEAGSQGVQEDADALVTNFPASIDVDGLRARVLALAPDASIAISELPDVDWSEAWKRGIRSHRLGALTVAPPWLAEGTDPRTTIVIEPEMAFGTGEHETTRGVLRLMQAVVGRGDRVADLGAGSAVLAIAAAKLGAASVAAIEMDADAIGNAEVNVARNGVADRVRVILGDAAPLLPLIAPLDVILANIISSVHVELLPRMGAALAPGGRAILSGILLDEREAMLGVLAEHGWRVEREDEEGAWWSVVAARA